MAQVNKKHGFTIIEVMLFLAVSGALMAGLLIGTSSSIARQRYNDSVSSFSDLLKEQYTFVANVQNSRSGSDSVCNNNDNDEDDEDEEDEEDEDQNRGRSNCFIYGKLIEFYDSILTDTSVINDGSTVRVTTIVGNDIRPLRIHDEFGEIIGYTHLDYNPNDDLSTLQAANLRREYTGDEAVQAARIYDMEWNSRLIEPGDDLSKKVDGAILIVRSPLSGTIKTFITNVHMPDLNNITSLITHENQTTEKLFCIASEDLFLLGTKQRMVRVNKNGGNASAVETMPLDVIIKSDGKSYEIPAGWEYKCQN